MEFQPRISRFPPVVVLINANDDTVEMVKRMLDVKGICCLTSCHFADVKKGIINFSDFLAKHNPAVVIFDISPPYRENWRFFETMRDSLEMKSRGIVLTTTNKKRLDEIVGNNSDAIEIVGKPYDLDLIVRAVKEAARERPTR